MSPYIWFALAMLAIVVVSLLVTGNLAAKFNERAKSDLAAALEPLAALVNGEKDVESATVRGTYLGCNVSAKVISGPGGMGRLFETTMTVPAGGESWSAVVRRQRDEASRWEHTFDGSRPAEATVAPSAYELLTRLLPFPGWFELKREPVTGTLTLTRAMQSRRDVPTKERFLAYLETLAAGAAADHGLCQGQGAQEAAATPGSPTTN